MEAEEEERQKAKQKQAARASDGGKEEEEEKVVGVAATQLPRRFVPGCNWWVGRVFFSTRKCCHLVVMTIMV